MKINKLFKNKLTLYTLTIFLFFLTISLLMPYGGDDWNNLLAGNASFIQIIDSAIANYQTFEGRFFSRIAVSLLVPNQFIWAVLHSAIIASIFYIIVKIINPKNKIIIPILVFILLFLDSEMFAQIYVWKTGSITYLFPMIYFFVILFYKKDIFYKQIKNEDKIIEYISQNEGENYSHIIKEDNSEEVLTTLSDIRKNIVYAYDFKPDCTILEVGAHFGEITGALCEKSSRVVSVEFNKKSGEVIAKRHFDKPNLEIIIGKLTEIEWKEKFDYIVLNGIVEYAQKLYDSKTPVLDLIEEVKKTLKEEGRLLIATDNKFAMKSYIGDTDECTSITFDSITGYKSSKKTYKLGKKELEKILQEAGFNNYKFLYPLPDYQTNIYQAVRR